jgi:hypothetical protein
MPIETCSGAIRKKYLLTYIVHTLDKYSKIVQNARYVVLHQDPCESVIKPVRNGN